VSSHKNRLTDSKKAINRGDNLEERLVWCGMIYLRLYSGTGPGITPYRFQIAVAISACVSTIPPSFFSL
jgi:hypothetical protein